MGKKKRIWRGSSLVDGYVHAQTDFLERHLVSWLLKFFERIQTVDGLEFYRVLTRILARFVTGEFAQLKASVPEEG